MMSSTRFIIENRTGEPVDLVYVDRLTGQPRRLSLGLGAAGALDGDPVEVRWLNAPPAPPVFLSVAEADAIDAEGGALRPLWCGLAYRVEYPEEGLAP